MPEVACPACPRPKSDGPCGTCMAATAQWGSWRFDVARSGFVFDGALRRLIHEMKYRGNGFLAAPLGAIAAQRIRAVVPLDFEVIVPMPGDPWRTLRRGSNPVADMARPVAEGLERPVLPEWQFRRGGAPAQMGLSSAARRTAPLRFKVDPAVSVEWSGARALLFDDVFTTGASVQAAAGALREAGLTSVVVWTLAAGG